MQGNSTNGNFRTFLPVDPFKTNLVAEALAREKFASHNDSISDWDKLKPYQKLSLSLIEKYTLNEEQKFAFLLFTDQHRREIETELPALRMVLGGPGGAGKSQVFDAIKEFYSQMGHAFQIKITAPTGLAANNVGGSTIHSETSL
ncbi:hypothetical protein M422DRAFT_180917, partial [Sphaerobolus stellatus SS14]